MAATDQPYRNQKTLDIVFGVSCVLLLVSTGWMFCDDHNRPYKPIQRKFRDVEEELPSRSMMRGRRPRQDTPRRHRRSCEEDLRAPRPSTRPRRPSAPRSATTPTTG